MRATPPATLKRFLALGALWLAVRPAHATPPDVFAFGARASALAGAVTADGIGFAAAHHNPAGVVGSRDVEAAVGYSYAFTRLKLDDAPSQTTTPRGLSLGLTVPLQLGRIRVGFGLALYLPDQFLLRIHHVPATEPNFLLLDNNLQHLVVTPVVAVAPLPQLSLGIGASILANVTGSGVTFDVGVSGGEKLGRARVETALPLRAAPVAGVRFTPLRWLRFGLAYRGSLQLDLSFDVLARVNVIGVVTGDVRIALRSASVYTPHRLQGGVAIDLRRDLTLETNVEWQLWSRFRGGVPDLEVAVSLGVAPALVRALFPDPRLNDTVAPRVGLEYHRRVASRFGVAGRVGYAFERSPVPDQLGITSFADNDRHVFATGAGFSLERPGAVLERPVSFDLALQWHELVTRTIRKDPRYFPGSGFTSSGRLVLLSATITLRF